MAKGVQFRGVPEVLRAFENIALANFAVMYDKMLQCKYQDASLPEAQALLKQYLASLERGGSSGIYTLHVFERAKGASSMRIKPSTEPDYAFNFTLFDEIDYPNAAAAHFRGGNQMMQEKITQLEAKLALLESEDDGEAIGGVQGFLNGLVDDPRTKQFIQEKIFGFVDSLIKPQPAQAQIIPMNNPNPNANPQPMGRVGAVDENSPVLIDEMQHQKLQTACEILARVDDKLGDNLMRIATLARDNPKKYENLISMLNTFI